MPRGIRRKTIAPVASAYVIARDGVPLIWTVRDTPLACIRDFNIAMLREPTAPLDDGLLIHPATVTVD